MKMPVLLVLLSLMFFVSNGQEVPNIRFVHIGASLRPIGTLLISIKKHITPNDEFYDDQYGVGIKTNKKTFKALQTFIDTCTLLVMDSINLDKDVRFLIKDNRRKNRILFDENTIVFFKEVAKYLEYMHLDENVVAALARKASIGYFHG